MKHKIKKYKAFYFDDYVSKHISFTFISFSINLCVAFIKLLLGFIASSYWFVITAGYYITLSIARGHLLYSYSKILNHSKQSQTCDKQLPIYYRSGYFLIIIGISYFTLCIWMYYYNQQSTYPEYILYGVVTIAFYKIGSAVYGLFQIKRRNNPILNIIKILNMIDACVSMVSVQCALLTMQKSKYASSSSALLGLVFSVFFMIVGILMIQKKSKE